MKQLIAGIVLIVVLGLAGFLYRNALEHPVTGTPPATQACTLEAKVCPDGTSVGRTGPACAFAPCPLPNIENAALGIAFVLPAGYTADAGALGTDATLAAVFDKPSKGDVPNSILVRRYPIPAGKTAEDIIIANTTLRIFRESGEVPEGVHACPRERQDLPVRSAGALRGPGA